MNSTTNRAQALRLAAILALLGGAPLLSAQPTTSVAIDGEPMTLSYIPRSFDGVDVDLVVLTAKSVQLVTDNFGAWTPHGEGTTDDGFVLKNRRFPHVTVTFSPFSGSGPGRDPEAWTAYVRETARRLGPETKSKSLGESGTPGSTPAFASCTTREVEFQLLASENGKGGIERHIVATDQTWGILIVLEGDAEAIESTEQDFRFLLARLARNK
jgi:hypothetical protein